jgi:hypothetical protein
LPDCLPAHPPARLPAPKNHAAVLPANCTAANISTHACRPLADDVLDACTAIPACCLPAIQQTTQPTLPTADDVLDASNLKKLFASDRVDQIMAMADKNKVCVYGGCLQGVCRVDWVI